MILILLKFIFFIASIVFFSWQFLRRVMKQNELYLLIPFSLGLGVVSYTFFVNIISYIIDVRTSFWLVLVLFLIAGIAFNRLKVGKIILGIEKKTFKALIITTLVMGSIFTSIIFNNYAYDETWHGGVIATIADGNFPVMSTYIPDMYVQYHYGFDLFAASLKSFIDLALPQSSDVGMVLVFLPIFWSAFVVIKKISGSTMGAWLSAWLLFFGGGFRYLTVVKYIDWSRVNYIWDFFGQILKAFIDSVPMSPGLFHSYSIDNLGVLLYHRPTLFAGLIMMFVFWLIYLEQKRSRLVSQVMLGLALGFLALSSESWFVLLAFSWGVWKAWQFMKGRSKRKKIVYSIITVTIVSSLVAIFQGGVITDMLLHTGQGTANDSMSTFVIRKIPGLISYGTIYPFNKIWSWGFLFLEWGLLLAMFPFTFKYIFKTKNKVLEYFLVVIVVTLSIIFWIDYPVASRDLVRVNVLAYWLIAILSGVYIAQKFQNKKKILIGILIAVSISPLMFNLRIIPMKWHQKDIYGNYDNKKEELLVAKEVSAYLTEPGAVLTAIPYLVTQSWGRQAYWGNPEEDIVFNRRIDDNLSKLLKEKSLKDISKRGVKYIYVNSEFIKNGGERFIEENKENLEKIYNHNDNIVYKIKS